MSLPRVVSQVVIVGSQILGKAFVEAYKQAARNARAGSSTSSGASSPGPATGSLVTRRHKMAVDEACQILNLKPSTSFSRGPTDPEVAKELEAMLKSYETMYKANEKTSKYLLSKVVRAKDRIEAEVLVGQEATGQAGKAAGPGATSPPP